METPFAGPPGGQARAPAEGLEFAVRKLIRQAHRASLATSLVGDGHPYGSLVTVAADVDGSPLLLLSKLADHTRNLEADPRLSLLCDGTAGYANPQQGPRATLLGRLEAFPEERGRRRFLARHPAAALYAGFADFALYRMRIERAHWVGGFARAIWLDRAPTCDAALAAAFAAAEVALLAEMNQRHGRALGQIGGRSGAAAAADWRLVAVDPDGCDLAAGEMVQRLDFASPLRALGELDQALVALAAQAGSNR